MNRHKDTKISKIFHREDLLYIETIKKIVWEIPSEKLIEKFGVSHKYFDKYCRLNNIPKPPRGYWQKLNANK